MKHSMVLVLLLFIFNFTHGQDTNYIKLFKDDFKGLYKHKKRIRETNDTATLIIEYNKQTRNLLAVHIDTRLTRNLYVYYIFGSNGMIWINVIEKNPHPSTKANRSGHAKYFYINNKLVGKQTKGYITNDYSYLINQAEFYRLLGINRIKNFRR